MAALPLQSSNNANVPGKTIEETYQKKTQLEHILLRPDTYVGSIEKLTQKLWVYQEGEMVYKDITYVPGLYKIFDEILVNAADNKQRDPSMDSVKVWIVPERNEISIYNSGDGVPIEIHKEHGVYVPELIFGHLLTSSNYDDSIRKTTGGRNGYGAKLTNIFSSEFVIETADGKRLKKYKQVFTENMGNKSEPVITKCKSGENWTKVTFKPDLAKFKMECLEEDVVALMEKRVVDLAGCLGKGVKVELNGQRVPVKSFSDYIDLYHKSEKEQPPRYLYSTDRWDICVCITSEGQFQQVSFVNGISTIKGGTHVDYITNQITQAAVDQVNRKDKNANIKAPAVKSHLWVFVNVLVDNPAFDSQTKETLTTRANSFGSFCKLPDDFLKRVVSKSLVDHLISFAKFKNNKKLKITDGTKKQRITGIAKLEDANEAGGKNSHKCTLILTEGDSAKALAMAGLGVVGRDFYGVFPLKGKLLNVREATHKQLLENAEIQCLKQILGLQQAKTYENVNSLRYGHVMIMTDQDHDGSHIKGLIINFIHAFWPSLLKIPSFVVEFVTPLLKAKNKRTGKEIPFYSMHEYDAWAETLHGNVDGYSIKYYKGLGTSKSEEAVEYFKDLERHKKDFLWTDDSQDSDAIELAFSKKRIEARKNWLRQYEPGSGLDSKDKYVKYSDFVHKELIQFSMADLQRSIPSMVDGFKPGQRKVLFSAFKRNLVEETKISQFGGYVAEKSAYHHGDQSLTGTIIGMAQDFVGSNNINLFQPAGQFGTRCQGGKDHASARYINTRLMKISRSIFPKVDDAILDYQKEDGLTVEPNWYAPIIPMVLVNGSEGIGTGWSSYIPNFSPRDIIANIRRLLNGETMELMDPWYRGFNGVIERSTKEGGCAFTVNGAIEEIDEGTIRITELPVRRWTQDYKQFLESIIESNDKPKEGDKVKERFIQDFRDHSTDTIAQFEVVMEPEKLLMAKQEGLLKKFKLTSSILTSNMHLFDARGIIKKYSSAEEILEEFYHLRLEIYEKRKNYCVHNLEMEVTKLENKVRFILAVINEEVVVKRKKKTALVAELREMGYTPFPKKPKTLESIVVGADDSEENGDGTETTNGAEVPVDSQGGRVTDYDYLLTMPIMSLTEDKIEDLYAEKAKFVQELAEMRVTDPKALWLKDLCELDMALDAQDKADAQKLEKASGDVAKKASKKPAARKATRKPKTASSESPVESSTVTAASVMDIDHPQKVVKPKGKAVSKKGAAKKKASDSEDEEMAPLGERLAMKKTNVFEDDKVEEDELEVLQARVAAYNLESDNSPVNESKEEEAPAKGRGRGRGRGKASTATTKTTIGAPAAKKRGPAGKQSLLGQKLITEVLKPSPSESSGVSPEKKVRRMRPSPFNKKSSSILGRKPAGDDASPGSADSNSPALFSIDDADDAPAATVPPPRVRTQRAAAARAKATIVLSSDEEDDDDDDDVEELSEESEGSDSD